MERALHFTAVHRKLLAVLYASLLLSHSLTFVLCSSSKTSYYAQDLPDDILTGLEEAFKSDHDAYSRVLYSLAVAQPFIEVLQDVISNINVFKNVAQQMADDTKRPYEDQQYRQFMHDFWSNILKENNSEHPDNGQQFDFAIPWEKSYAVAQYSFMRSVARLPPKIYEELLKVVTEIGGPIAMNAKQALTSARSANAIMRVSIVSVPLAYDVYVNIRRWWDDEITGTRCVKNILDNGAGMVFGIAGGVGGNIIGAWIGGFFGGPIGATVGALVGATVGAYSANTAATILISDKLTQWVFGLPKSEALENAYNFLGASPTDSNSYINSCYHQLARKYHPDKGGDPDNWGKLMFYMAVIKTARREYD